MKTGTILKKILLLTFSVIMAVSMFAICGFAADDQKPCYHSEPASMSELEIDTENFAYCYVCSKCEKTVRVTPNNDLYDASLNASGLVLNENNSATITNTKNLYISNDVFDVDAKPFWLAFDLTVNSLDTSVINYNAGSNMLNFSGNTSSPLRVYRVKSNGTDIATDNSDLSTTKVAIKSDRDGKGEILFYLEKGDTRNVALYCNPNDKSVEIYVDGEHKITRANALGTSDGEKWFIRFLDVVWAHITFDNFVFANVIDNHIHTDEWCELDELTVKVTSTAIESGYTCYCGEVINDSGIINLIKDNLVDSYEWAAQFEGMPTEGEYWIAFDYNVRSAITVSTDLIKIGDTVICSTNGFVSPTTINYAIKVKYTDKGVIDYTVYIDGKAVDTKTNIAIDGDDSVMSLGDTDAPQIDENAVNVRFNHIKIAEVGVGETKTPTFIPNELRPCYHATLSSDCEVKIEAGSLAYCLVCTKCGETLRTIYNDNLYDVSLNSGDNALKLNSDGSARIAATTYLYASTNDFADNADPFWLAFDLTANQLYINGSGLNGSGGNNLLNFQPNIQSPLRAYRVKANGTDIQTDMSSSDYSTTKISVRSDRDGGGVHLFYLEEGETVGIALYCDPVDGIVDIYVDGKYITTRTGAFSGAIQNIRFIDTLWADFTLDNFTFVSAVSETVNHTHSDKWCSMREKGVEMTENTFKPYYICYCGEKLYYGEISEIVKNNLSTVYSGTNTIETDTLDEVWFATDINIREIDVADGALIKRGEQTLLAIKNGAIVYSDGSTMEPISHRTTLSIAIKFVGDTAYELYCDGEWVSTQTNSDGDSSTVITIGDEAFGENVRFNYNKLVKIGEIATDETISYAVDEKVRPHYHSNPVFAEEITIVSSPLRYSYICLECGERAYVSLGKNLYDTSLNSGNGALVIDDSSATIYGAKFLYTTESVIGKNAEPFWLAFDINVNSLDTSVINLNNSGANLLNFSNNIAGLRALRVKSNGIDIAEDANDVSADKVAIKSDRDGRGEILFYLEKGDVHKIALYCTPADGKVAIYVDGEYKLTRENAGGSAENGKWFVRIMDVSWANLTLDNFVFANGNDHIHSDAWLTDGENAATSIVFTEDNKLAYSYECYCGQTVTYGISEVIEEEIVPVYGITSETVIIPEFTAPETDFWLVGEILAKKLPTEDGKTLVSIGDQVLLGINADGEFTVGGKETVTKLEADGEYHKLAFRFDVSKKMYTVYLDGAYVADAEYETLSGDVKLASEEAGKYHFDRAAVVVLSADGDISYKVAEGAHTHVYNPETSSLEFNAEKSTITINYTCTECNRPAFDGISENLYDNAETAEVEIITPVFGVETKVVNSELLTREDSYWFSFDAILKSELNRGGGALFKFIDNENNEIVVLTVYYDGSLYDAERKNVGKVGKTTVNITVNVTENDGEYSYNLYIDGKYIGKYDIALDSEKTYSIALGADFATTLELTEIKFAKMANGGTLEIGTFICADDEHINVIDKSAKVEYVDVNEFKFIYRCARCGKTTTEQITKSYYEATPHVYTAYGDMNAVKTVENKGDNYWIVADINVRNFIGIFTGYVPLISDNGNAVLLINYSGELMLADGTKVYRIIDSKNTYNIALKYQEGRYYLFLNGNYVGCTTGTSFKEGIASENSFEYFGSPKLENIRYYNIKSIETGVTDTPISVTFIEDKSVLPCPHTTHSFYNVDVVLDEEIKEIYTCSSCGERVVRINNKNILEAEKNTFIKNGTFTATGNKNIMSSEEYISNTAAPYWVSFTVNFEKIASSASINGANGGVGVNNGVTLFGTATEKEIGHLLRMFTVENGRNSFKEGVIELRDSNSRYAKLIATIYEGETHEFAIGISPSNGGTVIYMDGKLVSQRTTSILGANRAQYFFRFLDGNWGTFNVTNFKFVTAGKHEHTAKYTQYIPGGYDVLGYTDATLTHRYICYCGEEVVEGISKIFVDPIESINDASEFTAINGGATINMGAEPYWFSSKVTASGAANVYSYGEDIPMVEINSDRNFVVDGVMTELKASANGDYDIISVNVFPTTGEYDVYVNGSYLASGKAGFGLWENFNILLGGEGSLVSYSNLKLVRLAHGAEGRVIAFNCKKHDIADANQMIKTINLDENGIVTGLEYNCVLGCGYKVTSDIAFSNNLYDASLNTNGLVLDENNSVAITNTKNLYIASDVFNDDAKPFWLAFDLTVNSLDTSVISYGSGSNMLNFSGNSSSPLRVYRVRSNGTDIANDNSDLSTTKVAIRSDRDGKGEILFYLEKGDSRNVALYCNPADKSVEIYVDGEYKLTRANALGTSDGGNWFVRFLDVVWANLTLENFSIYSVDTGEYIYPPETGKIKAHFPKPLNPGTLTYIDGNIVHEFVCDCGCGKNIKQQTLVSLQNPELNGNKNITEFLNVRRLTALYVDEKLVTTGTPYYLAFEITADEINTRTIKSKGNISILSLVTDNPDYLSILRAYHNSNDDSIELGIDSFRVPFVVGETYSVVIAVNPTTNKVICSINGEVTEFELNVASGRNKYFFRFTDGVADYGQFDFTAIKFGYLTDLCSHIDETISCLEVDGKTSDCDKCESKVLVVHNYLETISGKWIKRECKDCGETSIVFRDTSLLKDMTFATDALRIEYLTKTYPPMFITIPNN